MKYSYKTPEEAIISLENAYSNNDLEAVIASKDFETEAILILEQVSNTFKITDKELIKETAELLELSLIKSLQENGFPNFENAEREFSDLQKFRDNIYVLNEKIIYPDNTSYVNKIYVINRENEWKVVTIEE